MEFESCFKSKIVADAENRFFPGQLPIGLGQAQGASGLHDTRSFIIIKDQRSFNAACGHNNTFGPDFNIPLIKDIFLFSDLESCDKVVVIGPDH